MLRLLMILALLGASTPASAATDNAAQLELLRRIDMRLAIMAYRLATANAALCTDRQPVPGIAVQALDQFPADGRSEARAVFGFASPIAVEGVVAGSPAALAGVRSGDAIMSVNGTPVPAASEAAVATSATRDAMLALVARQPVEAPLRLVLADRAGQRAVSIPPSSGCKAAFEVLLAPRMEASSDGRIVQIGVGYLERYRDDQVVVLVAHELAHIILRHRARLEAAGVSWGVLKELGKNGRLFRRTEDDADLLGLHLLRNAGYDPAVAVRFWRDHGGEIDHGIFRSRTHASSKARAAALEAELARIPAGAARPYVPDVLATRDQPLE